MITLSENNKYLLVMKPIFLGLGIFICQIALFENITFLLLISSSVTIFLTYHYSNKKLKETYSISFNSEKLKLTNSIETREISLEKIYSCERSNSHIKIFGVMNYGYSLEFESYKDNIEKIHFYIHESENNIDLFKNYINETEKTGYNNS